MTLQSSSDTHSPHPHQSKDVVQTSGRWPRCAERPAASSSHASVSLCHLWLRYVYVHAAVVLFQAAAPMQGAEAKEKSRQTSCPWEIEKKRVPQAAGSCSRTRNASPTPSGHVSQHVWYVLRPGISEKQRERERDTHQCDTSNFCFAIGGVRVGVRSPVVTNCRPRLALC